MDERRRDARRPFHGTDPGGSDDPRRSYDVLFRRARGTARFLRDKLGFPAVNLGEGWLIFDLPEADMGCHPADETGGAPSGTHNISFYCDDIEETVAELQARGVEFTGPVVQPRLWPGDLLPRSRRVRGPTLPAAIHQVLLEWSGGVVSGGTLTIRELLMARSVFLAALVVGHAIVLLASGVATLWWSSDLMLWLIHLVGEERALGADNVVPVPGGGKLLTNPGGMFQWTLPFWFLGVVQITGAITLLGLWWSRRSTAPASRSRQRGMP